MIKLSNILKEVYFSGFITTEEKSRFTRPENFDQYASGKDWSAWRGGNDWENGCTSAAVVFNERGDGDKSRVWFSVKYPNDMNNLVGESLSTDHPMFERINKFGKRVTNKWVREAQRVRREKPLSTSADGKILKRNWKECFVMALGSPAMKPYIKECGIDYTKWSSMKHQKKSND